MPRRREPEQPIPMRLGKASHSQEPDLLEVTVTPESAPDIARSDENQSPITTESVENFLAWNDHRSFRMFTAQLICQGVCRQVDIVRAFGVSKNSVIRSVDKPHGHTAGLGQSRRLGAALG